jgi:hypothetical protein
VPSFFEFVQVLLKFLNFSSLFLDFVQFLLIVYLLFNFVILI